MNVSSTEACTIAPNLTIARTRDMVNSWNVEFIDDDGGVEQAIFAGPLAEQRARTYALEQYGANDT